VRTRLLALVSGAAAAALAGAALLPGQTASAAAFGTPVVITGLNLSEPGIDVAPNGTLYVNAPPGIGSQLPFSPSYVFRSKDAGATWVQTPMSLRAFAPGGGDSDITVAPDTGALAMTDLWLGSSTVSKSTDEGNNWTANPVQGTFAQDRQWVAAVGGNVVYHVTHQIPSGITVAKSYDGGLTYGTQVVAATPLDQTGCVCPPGNMIAEAGPALVAGQQGTSTSDKVGVIYYTSSGGVNFARSLNGGLTWQQSTVRASSGLDTGGAFPVVASNGNGTLVAVWQESGSSSNVGFNISTDWGKTWGTAQVIVGTGSSVFPWVDVRGGKIAVSVFHTSSSGLPDNVPNSAQWYESYLESSTAAPTTWTTLVQADTTAVKSGPICTVGINCGGDRELGDFQAIVLDSSLRPNLTYARSINGASDTEIRFVRQ
jgi:hypothetical protein